MQMHKYTALAVVTMAAGAAVALTSKQAAQRAHLLKPVDVNKTGDGAIYQVLAPFQFKVGEQFATDMELTKAQADLLEPAEKTVERTEAKKREEARAKDVAALRQRVKDQEAELEQLRPIGAAWSRLPENVRGDALKAAAEAAAAAQKDKGK